MEILEPENMEGMVKFEELGAVKYTNGISRLMALVDFKIRLPTISALPSRI